MTKLEKIDGSNFLGNLYMKTEVMSFTLSKNFTIFNDLKIGLVCSVKDEKVIMRIARFCSRIKVLRLTHRCCPKQLVNI